MSDQHETRPIPGIDPDRYVARSDGEIVSVRRGRLLGVTNHLGRRQVTLDVNGTKTRARVHTLVALAFLGPRPERTIVGFINGNPLDTNPSNLRWELPTRWQLQGRYGEATHTSKLTEAQAIDALARMARGESSTRIAASYDVIPRTIRFLAAGRTWPHLPRPDGLRHRGVRRMLPRIERNAA